MYSQTTNNKVSDIVNTPSANAYSFKIFGDIPVSLYTGIPQIEVPIHVIKTGYVDIPISLKYHSGGFKPDVHPSWVGMGWNLNAGGVITREVRFIKDEVYNNDCIAYRPCGPNNYNGLGFYYSYPVLNKSDWYQKKDPDANVPEFPNFTYACLDRAPDIFSFNFLGYSGKFFLNHLGEWKVQCDSPLKIEINPEDIKPDNSLVTGTDNNFTRFTIIDEKGIRYIFGGTNAVEYSTGMNPCDYDYRINWLATSWYLTEIIPPVGDRIYFNYERGPYQSNFSYGALPYQVYLRSGASPSDFDKAHNYVYNGYLSDNVSGNVISGSIISPVYLTTIISPEDDLTVSFSTSKSNELGYFETTYTDPYFNNPAGYELIPFGYLGFDPTVNIPYFSRNALDKQKAQSISTFKDRFLWLKLDEINFTYSSSPVKKMKFYFKEQSDSRLRLDSVSTIYTGAQQKETYGFEYHPNLSYLNGKEYEYLSEFSDHWGFSNLKFLWDAKGYFNNNISMKSPVNERAKFGVLSKITYPTKGTTQFFYENHDYGQSISYIDVVSPQVSRISSGSRQMAGGLRIKQIVNTDGLGGYTSKEYIYEKPVGNEVISSGILLSRPQYLIGNSTTASHMFSNGLHVTYPYVVEKYEDNSFKVSVFTSEDYEIRLGENISGCVDDSPLSGVFWGGYLPHSSRDYERGKILDEYFCTPENKILKSKHYTYVNIDRNSSNFVRSVENQFYLRYYYGANPNAFDENRDVAFYHYTYFNKLGSIWDVDYKEDIFLGNTGSLAGKNVIIAKHSFEYDKYGQLIKENIISSDGKTQQTTTKYPYSDNPTSGVLYDMVKKNMLACPVEQKSYLGYTFQKGVKYDYLNFGASDIQLSSLSDINRDNSLTERYKITKYLGNKPVECISQDGTTSSFLYDMHGKKLKSVIKNAGITQIKALLSGSASIDNGMLEYSWESQIANLRNGLPNALVVSFDHYEDGNLKQETDARGVNTYYEYNPMRQLQSIKDNNLNIVKEFQYNFANKIAPGYYLNDYLTIYAIKNCPLGYMSDDGGIYYEVPEGVCISSISKEDANNKARVKYLSKAQEIADKMGNCSLLGYYSLIDGVYSTIESSNVYYQGNSVQLSYIMLTWKSTLSSISDDQWYTEGVIIGQLNGSYYPQSINYREFRDSSSTIWVVWIDSTGAVRVRLKSYPTDQKPHRESQLYIENLSFPLF